MLEKLGLCARSFCQQSSISWWMASGQSMGAGSLTRKITVRDQRRLLGEINSVPVTFLYSLDNILVGPVPVGPLSVAHHLPHHDTEGPDVGAAGELPEGDCLRSGPSDWDLASSGGVGPIYTAVADLSAQTKVCDLTNQLRVDQDITGSKVPDKNNTLIISVNTGRVICLPVDVVHLRQILHPVGNSSHHSNQLHHLKFPIVNPEESVQRSVLHVLGYNHDRSGFGYNSLKQEYYCQPQLC